MTQHSLVAVSAGLGQPSSTRMLADRLMAATARALSEASDEVSTSVIELRDIAQDMTNNLISGFQSEGLRQATESAAKADGLIVVSPIFSASYSGLFKMFFDVIEPDSIAGSPVLIAATAGTPRHSLALDHAMRPLFSYLRAIVVPTAVFAATEDWGSDGEHSGGGLVERIDRAAAELALLMSGGVPGRPADPFESVTSFEKLLSGE